jgi:hypothetical protein
MRKKVNKNDTEAVNDFMASLNHPLKAEIAAVRAIITRANDQIAEHIKWGGPSFFCLGDNDTGGMATINLRNQKLVHLVFHNGIIVNDATGLLEGDYKDRRMAYFSSMEDIDTKKSALEAAVNKWVELMQQ